MKSQYIHAYLSNAVKKMILPSECILMRLTLLPECIFWDWPSPGVHLSGGMVAGQPFLPSGPDWPGLPVRPPGLAWPGQQGWMAQAWDWNGLHLIYACILQHPTYNA